jgi:hypothetical protein
MPAHGASDSVQEWLRLRALARYDCQWWHRDLMTEALEPDTTVNAIDTLLPATSPPTSSTLNVANPHRRRWPEVLS